jgi:ABC-type uncharacterized transport system substrate-binding protein
MSKAQAGRRLFVGRSLAAIASWSSAAARSAVTAADVAVISSSRFPLVEQVIKAVQAGGLGSPPLPPMSAQWYSASSPDEANRIAGALARSARPPRVFFATNQVWARAIQIAAPEVPVVFSGIGDPTSWCLVDRLSRPGRSATGYMSYLPETAPKMIEALVQAYEWIERVLVLVDRLNQRVPNCDPRNQAAPLQRVCPGTVSMRATAPWAEFHLESALRYAESLGIELVLVQACSIPDLRRLLEPWAGRARTAVLIPWQALFDAHRSEVVKIVGPLELPAIYPREEYVEEGGLMSLEPITDLGRHRAPVLMLAEVLNGRHPSTLPVQTPRGWQLTIGTGAAAKLRRRPSLAVLQRADRLIHR